MNKTAIITISSYNYFPYGLNCLYSCKKYNKSFDLFYLVADRFQTSLCNRYSTDINFIALEQLSITAIELTNLKFKYNIVEFNTCIKPLVIKLLLEKGYNSVIYLDPDIECYSSFEQLLHEWSTYSIIVTPHKTTSAESPLIKDREFLNNGIYNLGFICVNSSYESEKFLDWWWNKLKKECFIDYEEGLATDQIWVELASTIFENFYVSKNLGLNVAFWNIHERKLVKKGNSYSINGFPLVFFHFSSLSLNCDLSLLRHIYEFSEDFKIFYFEHCGKVKNYDYDFFQKIPYEYSTYDDGKIIPKVHRWLFGHSSFLQNRFDNPFSTLDKQPFITYISSRRILSIMRPHNKKEKMLYIMCKFFGVDRLIRRFPYIKVVKLIAKIIG